MAELLKQKIHGAYGCVISATPATIFEQFEHAYTASLFYDFVLVDGLNECIRQHSIGSHPKRSMKDNFERLKSSGIAFDPYDVFETPSGQISEQDFNDIYLLSADRSPSDRIKMNDLIAEADAARSRLDTLVDAIEATQGYSSGGIVSIPHDRIDEHQHAHRQVNAAYYAVRNFMYELSATNSGLTLDSGRLLSADYDRNGELRQLLNEGKVPLGGRPSTTRPLTPSDGLRTFQLVLRGVRFPSDMPIDEFVDFRNSKIVRSSVRSFRKLASDLISSQSPASHVVEEIVDQYERYKLEVERTKKKTHVSDIKFVISSLAGFVEDIIKLRLESLTKRPFELAEYSIDRAATKQEYENSPFFFLYEKDTSVPRLEPNVRI